MQQKIGAYSLVIGIGGISRSGKSSVAYYLKEVLEKYSSVEILQIDSFLISPIEVFDEVANENIFDWETPQAWDLDAFCKKLLELKCNAFAEVKVIIAEGFLLYYRPDIVELLDIKYMLKVDKEISRARRKATKHYGNDYYFDEYIWKKFYMNNIYFNESLSDFITIDGNSDLEAVQKLFAEDVLKRLQLHK